MPRIYLNIGSNTDRDRNIRNAVVELRKQFSELAISPVYESPAAGFEGAPFFNLAVSVESTLAPEEIVRCLRNIESRHGRTRGEAKFASRTLDIDLVMWGDLVQNDQKLPLPRPDLLKYPFVLKPMVDLNPKLLHPVTGQTMQQHWHAMRQENSDLHQVAFDWNLDA